MARANRLTLPQSCLTNLNVEGLAERALATIQVESSGETLPSRSPEMDELFNALVTHDDTAYQDLILYRIANGEAPDAVIDQMIPDLARRLGEGWMTDNLSFADVTIGSSRLQRTVRSLGARYEVDGLSPASEKRVLLISPETDQHTLGIFIAANQLRRQGVWVQLELDLQINQIDALLKGQKFAMIGLSLGTEQSMSLAGTMIDAIRAGADDTPVVLSGSAIAGLPSERATRLGADFIAGTACEALDLCDINTANLSVLPLKFVSAQTSLF